MNNSENITYQNLWRTAALGLTRKCMALSASIRKAERSQINNTSFNSKKPQKEEQIKPRANQKEETVYVSAEIIKQKNNRENAGSWRRSIQLINL